ncbi:hypothetical protein DV736_g5875, partial [Chaetothyriales sp. CBS 134916]
MSHPPTPGKEPKRLSPKSVPPEAAGDNISFGFRLNTSGASPVEYCNTYPSVAPVARTLGRQYATSQPSPESASQTTTRALGVHNILNPSEGDLTEPQLPSFTSAPNYRLVPPASPRSRKRPAVASPIREHDGMLHPVTGRRLLTPKSPGQRAASLGTRRNPTYHGPGVSFQSSIGLEPHVYTAEPGTADIPALPSLSSTTRTSIPSISPPELPPLQSRTPGQPVVGIGIPIKRSESPSTSQTSLGQPEQVSPAFHYNTAPGQQQSHRSRFRLGSLSGEFGSEGFSHGPSDTYPTGQTGYQMTLETDQGPLIVPVELDLQQASKVADEKRKRNAGASARFRARRKEKEKEASQKISDLQQELREMKQGRDFYRNERDFFRDFAASRLGPGQIPPRPLSPFAHRQSVPPSDLHRGSEDSGRPRSDSAPTVQRQRTNEYPASFTPVIQSVPRPLPSPYPPSRPPPPPGQQGLPLPLPPAPPQQHPVPYASPRQLPPGPPGPPVPLALGSRSQSFDPFRKDPYDRSWNPGR